MVIHGGERRMQAIGRSGVIVAALDRQRAQLQPPHFNPEGIRLNFVEPGSSFHLDTVAADAMDHSGTGLALLKRAIDDLLRDYNRQQGSWRHPIAGDELRAALLLEYTRRESPVQRH